MLFSKFLEEGSQANKFVDTVRSWGYANPFNPVETIIDNRLAVEVVPFDDNVTLKSIRSFSHKQGHGSEFMQKLTYLADSMNITIELDPHPLQTDKRIPLKKLLEWYKRFGFKGSSNGMIRRPV